MPGPKTRRTMKKRSISINRSKSHNKSRRKSKKCKINPKVWNQLTRAQRIEQEERRRLLYIREQRDWELANPELHERNKELSALARDMQFDFEEALEYMSEEGYERLDLLMDDDLNLAVTVMDIYNNGGQRSEEDIEMINSWIARRINYP